MKLSQFSEETKTFVAAALASGALCAEAVVNAVERPNIRTLPTAAIGIYLTVGLVSLMRNGIKKDAATRKEVIQTMENSQAMKDAMNPFK